MSVFTKYFNSHFLNEHVQGHHKYMCTPEDGASSHKNESVWAFLVREYWMGRLAVWKREVKRIKKEFGQDTSVINLVLYNQMFWLQILHLSILVVIYHFLGWQSLKFQLWYVFWGNFWLGGGNYIEHYGINRKKDKNGIYESVGKMHSWNAPGSALFFQLHRHSDHHMAAFRPY